MPTTALLRAIDMREKCSRQSLTGVLSRRNIIVAVVVCAFALVQRFGLIGGAMTPRQTLTLSYSNTMLSEMTRVPPPMSDASPPTPMPSPARFPPPINSHHPLLASYSPPPPMPTPRWPAAVAPPPRAIAPPPRAFAPPPELVVHVSRVQCTEMQQAYRVVIGTSWGSLPITKRTTWSQLKCDALLTAVEPPPHALVEGHRLPTGGTSSRSAGGGAHAMAHAGGAGFLADYRRRHDAALAGREPPRRLQRNASSSGVVIAVCASTTSRNLRPTSLEQLSLFRLALPSLASTFAGSARAAVVGTEAPPELWAYVAYDAGDRFYDTPVREAAVRAWLDARLVAPLTSAGLRARHALLRFDNALRKPGPIFNFMMAAAAADGADYLYRINDDTEFVTPWVAQALGTLRGYEPSNVGVVGPVCREGNTKIITHDLVHRTHLAIFDYYYPPILSDWWMDDWITRVYDAWHFTKGPFLVRHHTGMHGTRYDVDYAHEAKLQGELAAGRSQIEQWLHERGEAEKK